VFQNTVLGKNITKTIFLKHTKLEITSDMETHNDLY